MYFNSKQPFPKCPNIQPNGTGREAQTKATPTRKNEGNTPLNIHDELPINRDTHDTLRASNIPLSDMNTVQFALEFQHGVTAIPQLSYVSKVRV